MPETKNKKDQDFNEWYNEIVELADLCDKRYPIKGMNVWRPYGWKIMNHIDQLIKQEMVKTNHEEVNFPLLIPESSFKKEEEHIEGFGSEVFWITHAGLNKLEEKWLLRPTSETAMYPMFSLWVRSHADLPLKTFQIVNTFRYETKQTKAFIRVREIHFFESHTCHKNYEDAEKQIQEDKIIAKNLFKKLCLPFIFCKRPEWDKFAGAYYTLSIDVLMPSGKTLQLGSIHQYRDNFSKPYDIKYESEDGKHNYCHQTTYGMSERILGALIGIHGDDKGIIIPPDVAPIQVIIIPIIFKGKEGDVIKNCHSLRDRLNENGIRTIVDDRDITPGNKYYDRELKGVPIRIEIGPREVEKNEIVIVRRDIGVKTSITQNSSIEYLQKELDKISQDLFNNATKLIQENIHKEKDLDTALKLKGIIELPWCGDENCALEIENILDENTLGEPIEDSLCEYLCPICKKKASKWMRYAKTY